jgi:RES domain-containing protein
MRAWRIVREPHVALDGEGARLFGGRWNSSGSPVIYLSASLALCALEILVHLDLEDIPSDYRAVRVEIPDAAPCRQITLDRFPRDWEQGRDSRWFQEQGDTWLADAQELVLQAPSAIVPQEPNLLLNPRHPLMQAVTISEVVPFRLDERLVSRQI